MTVRITDAGMVLREKAAAIPAQMASCADLTPEEAAELYRILYKILS